MMGMVSPLTRSTKLRQEPCVSQDDEDDDFDEDDFKALHDCCEQCGTDWEDDNE
jgi:hypothetical protein